VPPEPKPPDPVPLQPAAQPEAVLEPAPAPKQEPAREQDSKKEPIRRSWLPLVVALGIAAAVAGYFLLSFLGGGRNRARDAVAGPPAAVPSQAKQDSPPVSAPATVTPTPPKVPEAKAADEKPQVRPEALSDAAIRDFVDKLLEAAASGDVQRVLPFYADRVDYYAMGPVGQDVIRQDKQTYYTRWPEVKLHWKADPSVSSASAPNTVIVGYYSSYDVSSPARNAHASGTIETLLRLELIDGALKIVSQREFVKASRQ